MDLHELTAGYALDALEPAERGRYEDHLASCERCRDELQGFWSVSGALAHAAGGPSPPASLRSRILEQARSERPNVVPLRRRFGLPAVSSVAAVAAVVAIGLGVWATSLASDLDDARQEIAVLGHRDAQAFEAADGEARLVVTPAGEAALVVRSLPDAPEGQDYEIWVFEDDVPRPAGLFDEVGVALLSRPVARGQTVAVTLEQEGGVDAPTGEALLTTTRA
jgi:anti-sigma-K factor RskA